MWEAIAGAVGSGLVPLLLPRAKGAARPPQALVESSPTGSCRPGVTQGRTTACVPLEAAWGAGSRVPQAPKKPPAPGRTVILSQDTGQKRCCLSAPLSPSWRPFWCVRPVAHRRSGVCCATACFLSFLTDIYFIFGIVTLLRRMYIRWRWLSYGGK